MGSLGKIVKAAMIVYIALVGCLYLAQRDMIYFPVSSKPSTTQSPIENIQEISVTTVDGVPLYGWHLPASAPQKPTIFFFHGNASNILWQSHRAKPYAALGYGVLMVEYRGYGGNAGNPSEQGLYNDARAFLDWLQEQEDHNGIILYGESLGTGVAVQMATEYPAKAVVLEAPYTSFVDVAKETYWFVPVRLLMKDRFDSLSRIGNINAPLIVVTGDVDTIIPAKYAKKIFEAANDPKHIFIIEGAGHNDLEEFGVENNIIPVLQTLETKQ